MIQHLIDMSAATRATTKCRSSDRIALNEAIRQLSPGYRAVLILHDVEGYEHGEISEILGCAVGTSKSQLHKARMKLRRLLKKQAPRKGESDARLEWLKLHSHPLVYLGTLIRAFKQWV